MLAVAKLGWSAVICDIKVGVLETSTIWHNITSIMTSDEEIASAVAKLHHLRRRVACAMHVHCRPTGVDGLDKCPRSRRQCQSQANACPNKLLIIMHRIFIGLI